jgi:RTX calcium-binding nonapeptide repeat (4 copies)
MGCTVLLMVVGCAGAGSQASQEEQGNTEATKEQARSSEATASEEARCEGTRTIKPADIEGAVMTTNDLPGCPKGGLLSGTNEDDNNDGLYGGKGDDEIHGLGGVDTIIGGGGNDVIYAGPGNDTFLSGFDGDDVIYGGDGNEEEMDGAGGDDVIYGGDGDDYMYGEKGEDVLYGGMATISWTHPPTGRTSSIAAQAGTDTVLVSKTTWTAAARRRLSRHQLLHRRRKARPSALL